MMLRQSIKYLKQCRRVSNALQKISQTNCFSTTCTVCINKQPPEKENATKLLGEIGSKYQVFDDKDASVILDINEERLKYSELEEHDEDSDKELPNPFEGINLEHGVSGVFEIEDLVHVLRRDNAVNVCVIAVSPDVKYVDYICIVSGKSQRHMSALAQFVKKVYKQKMYSNDYVPKIEGKKSKDWLALDLGNIALHIFSSEARTLYDLDSLWSVGPQYDAECNKPEDPTNLMLEKHSFLLHDLQPAS